ncbi:hypothetical protein BGZ54_001597 [Gamsiella multidivaricata]|nr:hypothetical protein BGZ54_001597 [Gamsiella multidivaricata]
MIAQILANFVPRPLIPRVETNEGLRQLQITTLGFAILYGLLHLSLFMDGMVNHVFFAVEIGTALIYAFLPVTYSVRRAALLKRRFYMLIGHASLWFIQPLQLALTDDVSLLFDKREDLQLQTAKALNQAQIERIIKKGGKVEENFVEQTVYAGQMAALIKVLAWSSMWVGALVFIEAVYVWRKSQQMERAELSSSAEREKREAQAAAATTETKAKAKADK